MTECPLEQHSLDLDSVEVHKGNYQKIKNSAQYRKNSKKCQEIKSELQNQLNIVEEMISEREKSLNHLEVLTICYNFLKKYKSLPNSYQDLSYREKIELIKKHQMRDLEKVSPNILKNMVKSFSTDFSKPVHNYLLQSQKLNISPSPGLIWLGNSLISVPVEKCQKVFVKNVSSEALKVAAVGVNLGNGEENEGKLKNLKVIFVKRNCIDYDFPDYSEKYLIEIPLNDLNLSKNSEYTFEFTYYENHDKNIMIMTEFENTHQVEQIKLKIRSENGKPEHSSLAYIKFSLDDN
jgi:hypothetical protein